MAEIVEMTWFSKQTVTRLFEGEKGVLIIHRPTEKRKRRYRTIRIPTAVYERVIRGLTVK